MYSFNYRSLSGLYILILLFLFWTFEIQKTHFSYYTRAY